MSVYRDADPSGLERLLAGGPAADQERLAAVLAAAAAPARPEELTGEQAALVAFRDARLTGFPTPRRQSMVRLAAAKLLTVKAAAIGIGVVTLAGGAALAATGTIPNPVDGIGSAPAADEAPVSPSTAAAQQGGPGEASPSPSLAGLCVAYHAGAADNEGAALDNPAFEALVGAAGSHGAVADYCADLTPHATGLCTAFLAGAADHGGLPAHTPAFEAMVTAAGSPEAVADYCADLVSDAAADRPGGGQGRAGPPADLPTPTDRPTVDLPEPPGRGERPDEG